MGRISISKSPMKELLARLTAIGFGLIFSLALSELTLRLATPKWLSHRMRALGAGEYDSFGTDAAWPVRHDRSGEFVSFRPGSQFRFHHYEYSNVARIDELGGRVTASPSGASDNVPLLGDSFLFGVGVEDSQTFASLLASSSDRRYVNLGVPGTSLSNQLDILERRYQDLGSPGVVVFFIAIANDFEDILRYNDSIRATERSAKARSWLWYVNRRVFHNSVAKRSYLLQWIKSKAIALRNRRRVEDLDPFFLLINNESSFQARLEPFARQLERLRRFASDRGFRAKIVLVPSVFQVSRQRFELMKSYYGIREHLAPDLPNEALGSKARSLDLAVLDPLECLRDQSAPEALYYELDNHLTAAGNLAMADCLTRADFESWLAK